MTSMSIKELSRWKRWLFICGVMPWNWFSNDIWTAHEMVSRELARAQRQAGAA